jgi:hypothetical protein
MGRRCSCLFNLEPLSNPQRYRVSPTGPLVFIGDENAARAPAPTQIGSSAMLKRRCSKQVGLKTKLQSAKVQSEICLGVTVAGIEILVGLGIILLLTNY